MSCIFRGGAAFSARSPTNQQLGEDTAASKKETPVERDTAQRMLITKGCARTRPIRLAAPLAAATGGRRDPSCRRPARVALHGLAKC
ncbi:hypothetical protein MRX96_047330 [Rhipicephalus microplus]